MQIDSIEVFHLALPLRQPQNSPLGPQERLETVVVRLESGGAAGWGEASPGNAPLAGSEWAAGVFGCVRDWLAPAVAGQSVDSGQRLQELMAAVQGNRFAKAALDTAWWDLEARLRGEPLHRVLGGRRDAIPVGVGFDRMADIEELFQALHGAFDAGFARVELKFRPGWEISMVNLVRHEFPTETFHVDCEAGLKLQHTETLLRLDDFHLAMVEQPLPADDLVGHAMLQESLRTPISLDESITTVDQASVALELHSGKFVNVKPARVGGLTPAQAIHDCCHDECTPCWVGALPQSSIGARIGYALAAKENFSYPADLSPPPHWLADDLVEPLDPVRDPADGKLRVPLWTGPGIGVEPDLNHLQKFCLARAKFPSHE
jgi:O-succinylbenzoate synthase